LTHGCEEGVADANDDVDEIDGEAKLALGTTCLMISGEDALKGDAV